MNTTVRALLMIFIFAGSICCKVFIYSQGQIESKTLAQMTYFKSVKDQSQHSRPADCAWNRLFKSKRRIEKYGFIQKAFSAPPSNIFYSVVTSLLFESIHKPSVIEVFPLIQPPRSLATI